MKVEHFSNFIVRSILAVIGSTFIVFHGRWDKIGNSPTSTKFWLAFLTSFVIACMMVEYNHRITEFLYLKYGNKRLWLRIILQIVGGVVVTLAFNLLLVFLYTNSIHQPVYWKRFLFGDFPIIVIFTCILNFYFFSLYLVLKVIDDIKSNHDVKELPEQITLTINADKKVINLKAQDILYFYLTDRKMTVTTASGELYITNQSLKELNELLSAVGFLQINRQVIVNPVIVKGYEKKGRDKIQIIMNPVYESAIRHTQNELFPVTGTYISGFKKRFKMLIET